MAKIYFELPWCILGRDGASGYALAIASLRDVLQQIFEAVNLVHTVDLGACLALAGQRLYRWLRQMTVGPFLVQQIELELKGQHRLQPQSPDLLQRSGKHVARLKAEGVALAVVEGEQELPERALGPGHWLQGSWQRPGDGIGIPVGKALAARIVTAAAGIEQEDGSGETDS